MTSKPHPHAKAERNRAICERLRAGGITMAEIARELGLSHQRIYEIARRGGITQAIYYASLPPTWSQRRTEAAREIRDERAAKKAAFVARIVEFHSEGLSQREIAHQVKISQKRVSRLLIGAGLRTKHQPIRVFQKPKPKRSRVKPPAFVPLSKQEQTPHAPGIIEAARALWDRGLSAREIAIRITNKARPITRNAVIGIAHRNHFPSRPSPLRKAA